MRKAAKKAARKSVKKPAKAKKLGPDHECFWREASMKLARCVVFTLQANGKLGIGSGMVMKREGGKIIAERWDKDFKEALSFIGLEVVDKPNTKPRRGRREDIVAPGA